MDYTFWQSVTLKWKELKNFCLWALSSDPSGLIESGMYYNTTANRAALRDDTKTQLLAHLEDTYKNAGVIKQPTITKGTNSITVGNDAVIRCYKTTDYSGIIQEIANPTGGTFALAQNVDQWLIYTYGVGYSIVSSIPTVPLSNIVPVFRYFNAFGVIHSSTQDELGKGAIEKTLVRIARTEYIERVGESGIELSTSGLNVLISGGYAYDASVIETILPFNSATNNLYRVVYDDGVWSQTTLHALTNTHYNPSTGLTTLNSNKYCWAYVWRSVGDDVEAFFQLGEKEYATEALASADLGKMPANLYGLYVTHCVLVGYVLIKQGVTTTQFFSAWGKPAVAGAPVYHNTLAGIDGGDPSTSYNGHTKLIDNTRLNAAGAANGFALLGADGKLPSGQLPSYVDDVLEYAAKANFPATGENGKIYVDLATSLTWRWSGTTYVEISPSLALGETSATAYRGDRGKTAYNHSQLTASNPHGTTASQISSTATGDISATNVQAAIAELASEKLAASAAAGEYVSKTETDLQSIASNLNSNVANMGYWVADITMARFGHKDHNTTVGFGFLQTHSGDVYVCAPSGEGIHFRINNDEKAYMDGNGYFHFSVPEISDYSDKAVTSAWVKDVAAPISHTHTTANVTGLDTALAGKASKAYYNDDGAGKLTISSGAADKNLEIKHGTTLVAYTGSGTAPLLYVNHTPAAECSNAVPTTAWVKDVAAPISHASTATTYGVGDANNFGHVRVDSTPTIGSGNAVSSGAVADALGYKAPQITLAWGNTTLPVNAPLATQVLVDGSQVGYSGALVTAPSGEYINKSGSPGTYQSVYIGGYRGCWFVKTWSNRWTPVGAAVL